MWLGADLGAYGASHIYLLASPRRGPTRPRLAWGVSRQLTHLLMIFFSTGLWRNGSASDSRSEGWEFETLWPHDYGLSVVAALRHELLLSWAHVLQVEIAEARSD